MEKNELKELIREVVKEEIRIAFGRMIITDKSPKKRKLPSKVKANESRNVKKPIRKTINKPKQNYSNNSVLNDVLNETAHAEEYKTMGGGTYDSSKMSEVLGKSYGDMMNNDTPNVNQNDPMAQFINKDYREVLKKTEEKQQQKYGK